MHAQVRTLTNTWACALHDSSDSSPGLGAEGTIYFGSFDGKLWALNPDGSCRWIFTAGREIRSSPAIGADGTIYFGSRDRNLYALSPQGKRTWAFATGDWVDSSPALAADGTIYFGSWDKRFYALTPEGHVKWQFQTAGPIDSSPAVGRGGMIYFGSHDGKFYALNPDGTRLWAFATGGPIISSPALSQDGDVFFTSVDGYFYALDLTGGLRWRLRTGGITDSSPVIGPDGTLYVGVNTNLWAVLPNGTKQWDQPDLELIEASPLALADNTVCFLTQRGLLINLDAQRHWHWTCWLSAHGHSSPVLSPEGVIYIFGSEPLGRALYALPAKVPLARSPWPKFRGDAQNTGRLREEGASVAPDNGRK